MLPAGIDALVFDWAVHSGPSRAVRALQKVLGLTSNGVPGAALQQAMKDADIVRTIQAVCKERRQFLSRLKGFAVFGRGWSRRVDVLEKTALSMAHLVKHRRSGTQEVSKGE